MKLLDLPAHSQIDEEIGRHIGVKQVDGRRLAYLASLLPDGAQVVECGSFWGRSGAYILSGNDSIKLHCVDKWDNEADRDKFIDGMIRLGYYGRVTHERCNSWEAEWNKPIDMLFLDSTHRYAVLEREWEKYYPLVKSGGIVAFHDYSASVWPEVKQFVDAVAQDALVITGVYGTVWSGVKP